jgi:radical SAM-linked protein
MTPQRLRIRFRKQDDLRWISHRDLVRAFERLLRRAQLAVRMSEGFHPKPRMSFPSALALGIEGQDEVMELELVDSVPPREVQRRLAVLAPPGLVVTACQQLPAGTRKARVRRMGYRFPVPVERRADVCEAMERLQGQSSLLIQRAGRQLLVNVRTDLEELELRTDTVQFYIRATQTASISPRDVLSALRLNDLEQQGCFLTRTEVELIS